MSRTFRRRPRGYGKTSKNYRDSVVHKDDTFSGIDELEIIPVKHSRVTIRHGAIPVDPWEDLPHARGTPRLYHRASALAWKTKDVNQIVAILRRQFPGNDFPLDELRKAAKHGVDRRRYLESADNGRNKKLRSEAHKAYLAIMKKCESPAPDYEADLRESKVRFRDREASQCPKT